METRGFFGRRPAADVADRIPPGQSLTDDFPVLSAGPTPRVATDDWSFTSRSARARSQALDLGRVQRPAADRGRRATSTA